MLGEIGIILTGLALIGLHHIYSWVVVQSIGHSQAQRFIVH